MHEDNGKPTSPHFTTDTHLGKGKSMSSHFVNLRNS